MTVPMDDSWAPYLDQSTSTNHASGYPHGSDPLSMANHAADPNPSANSHLSAPTETGPLSPCSTIDPSDSVSHTHSPPRTSPDLEDEIPRQSTDEENMLALGDILGRAAQHQKNLRMSRLTRRAPFGAPPAPSSPPAPPPAPSSPLRSIGTSNDTASKFNTSPSAPKQSPPKQSPLPQTQLPTISNIDSMMMPPDPFAESEPTQFPSLPLPLNDGSPPADPFLTSPSGNGLRFDSPPTAAPVPWTFELAVVGLFTGSPTADRTSLPVAIAAMPNQNVAPELWPSTPFMVHPGSLSGPTDLLNFHSLVETHAIPTCFLVPYVQGMADNYQAQIAVLTKYERLTHSLLEKNSFVRVIFPIEGGPQETGLALYPRFDHQAGAYRLIAALFTSTPVPMMSAPAPPAPAPAPAGPPRRIAPLPHPMRHNRSVSSGSASTQGATLLNVDRPFGDGQNQSQNSFGYARPQPQTASSLPIQPVQYQLGGQPLPNAAVSVPATTNMGQQVSFPPPDFNQGYFDSTVFPGADQMQQYGQSAADMAYYGVGPSGYPQSEDIVMDTGTSNGYSYPVGAGWKTN